MREYKVSDEIKRWVYDSMLKPNATSPIGNGMRRPYKPFLILAIIAECGESSFNRKIHVKDIAQNFYKFLISDDVLWEGIKNKDEGKLNWSMSRWDEGLEKKVIRTICLMPAEKLKREWDSFYQFDKKNKTIYLNYHGDTTELVSYLKDTCTALLHKILPNTIYSLDSINDDIFKALQIEMYYDIVIKEISKSKKIVQNNRSSKMDRLYARIVKERDNYVCQVCDDWKLVEAAHLYHFSKIKNDLSRGYDFDNGITLCRNCHGMHNRDLIAFKDGRLQYCEHLGGKQLEYNDTLNWHDPKNMNQKQIQYGNEHYNDFYKCKKEATQ